MFQFSATNAHRQPRSKPTADRYTVRINGSCVYDGYDERAAMDFKPLAPDAYTHITIVAENADGEISYEWESP